MILRKWDALPDTIRNQEIKKYYDNLYKKRFSLYLKRAFDIILSLILLLLCSPFFAVFSVWIKLDSKGPVFFRQVRVTQYAKQFRIIKFRTMVQNAEKKGELITSANDARITKIGKKLRDSKLDELGQLLNILKGDMTFVGVRPEVQKYVDCYTPEMMATLLLPAGITSRTSLYYKSEEQLLAMADDRDKTYREEVLPAKMYYNLKGIEEFSLWNDMKTLVMTFLAVVKHIEYNPTPEELIRQRVWCEKNGKLASENEQI